MRILYVHHGQERFVRDDLALFAQEHTVTDWHQRGRWFNPAALAQAVRDHDLVFCWFASWHALAPVLLARRFYKPALVVVGGYDTANLPEAGYGSQRGGLRRWMVRVVIEQASHLIVNSQAACQEAIVNAGADPGKITVIYHGVNPLPMGPSDEREQLALTVGGVWRENLLRKGLLPFVEAAAHLPHVRFVVAGRWYDDSIEQLRRAAGSNVEFTGYLSDDDLAALYGRASVYVQASLHEGFGLSVAEAMSAGCIPVVSRLGALPEVVGETGHYLDSLQPSEIAKSVAQVLSPTPSARLACRKRVLSLFPMRRRFQTLQTLLSGIAGERVDGAETVDK